MPLRSGGEHRVEVFAHRSVHGEEEDVAYMAMELLEGQDLRSRMRREQIPPMEAVEIALQVADGLGFAHEHGVVHRDVKPGNIMLLERGAVKIMDFGIARMRFADHKTSTGMVLGTPRYMSPEQISGLPVDQRSDIFSLGTVLYEMLTQTSLFAGQNVDQIAFNVTTNEPAPPSHKNPELPQILDFIVARALKKEPSVRYQDAYEMAADLRDALAEMRGRAPAREPESETTMTQKIGAGADKVKPGLAGVIDKELNYLERHWADALPQGVIHADLFPDNVFFLGDKVSGLIDFYFACNDMLAYDIAVCLNAWCFEPDGSFNVTKAKLMFESYRRLRPIPETEMQAMPLLARGAALRFLLTRLYDWLNHPPGAFVKPKDPMEYIRKLRFHQAARDIGAYGLK